MGTEFREINDEIAAAYEEVNADKTGKAELIKAVLSKHCDLTGRDSAFARSCVEWAIDQHVRRFFNGFKPAPVQKQDALPGMKDFKRLQRAYLVAGEIVKLHAMTSGEMTQQAKLYRSMGGGCYQHADELERFRDDLFGTD